MLSKLAARTHAIRHLRFHLCYQSAQERLERSLRRIVFVRSGRGEKLGIVALDGAAVVKHLLVYRISHPVRRPCSRRRPLSRADVDP